jgi:hypothetical protein
LQLGFALFRTAPMPLSLNEKIDAIAEEEQ